jgi:hypothetical protein
LAWSAHVILVHSERYETLLGVFGHVMSECAHRLVTRVMRMRAVGFVVEMGVVAAKDLGASG